METVIRIRPHMYIHVLDTNENVTRVVTGPKTYTKKDEQTVVLQPSKMVNIPPRHYAIVENPVQRHAESGEVLFDDNGQAKLFHGSTEIRLNTDFPDPFPLYPGESLVGDLQRLLVVEDNTALLLKANRDFLSADGKTVAAGDEWLFKGPSTYTPRVEVDVEQTIVSIIIKQNSALRLRSKQDCVDYNGDRRRAGEEWLVRKIGAYLPTEHEEVLETVQSHILTERRALHLHATKTFKDIYGVERRAGSHWLVTMEMAETHLRDVYEEIVGPVDITTLNNRQYAVLVDYYEGGVQKLGSKKLVKGECSFFLKPGESFDGDGISEIVVLAEDEALLLKCDEEFDDTYSKEKVHRIGGEQWMIYGPCEYVPPVEVAVLEKRVAMPLDENEGVYVRNKKTGQVRSVIGETYMLLAEEELWEKLLTPEVEELLLKQSGGDVYVASDKQNKPTARGGVRNKTAVVSFRVPHNAAVQVYDYKVNRMRIVFGPELVMLGPHEELTTLSLSGDKPKRPNVLNTLCLMLGPDFMTDIVTVETCDHARLQLQLAYNWHFKCNAEDAEKIFNVKDFVGDAAKAMASRVRGVVAAETFDNFHKNSAKLIRSSIFGTGADGKIKDEFLFDANNLVITNVDIQAVEPVDDRTRESLQKSVQLAIEITTASLEARAKHEAKREEEHAKGKLEQQTIRNQVDSENEKKTLLKLQAETLAIEAKGSATAEARAAAETAQIEGQAAVKQAKLRAEALRIETECKIEQIKSEQDAEISHKKQLIKLQIDKAKELAEIEAEKFRQTVEAIGPDTITSIAQAGPEMQAKLLQGLGLKGFLVTDGKNPINLFQTANGFVGGGLPQST